MLDDVLSRGLRGIPRKETHWRGDVGAGELDVYDMVG